MDPWYPHYYYVVALITGFSLFASAIAYYLDKPRMWLGSFEFTSSRTIHVWLAFLTVGLYLYVFFVGNRQFGGFDHSILIDAGWRLASGQVPYIDFICTLPPAFMLGPKAAFLIGGPSWDSLQHLYAIFACVTFVWLYLLLSRVLIAPSLALIAALWLESTSTLTTAFWGYNTIASISAGIYLLSALVLPRQPSSIWRQLSYAASLLILSLMKPNTAFPLIIGATVLLLSVRGVRVRVAVLTVAAIAAAYLILSFNHFSLPLLMASYKTSGQSRGGFRSALLLQFTLNRATFLLIFTGLTCLLLAPFLLSIRWLIPLAAQRRYLTIQFYLLLCLGPVVGSLAMLTNGEHKLVDMVLFIIPGAILLFGNSTYQINPTFHPSGLVRSLYIGLCFGLAGIAMYTSFSRFRVATIGPYFEEAADQQLQTDFFPHLTTGKELAGVLHDTQEVLTNHPKRPIFFGPRMEFCYAAFKLDSPKYLPIWWDPGTAFSISKQSDILSRWEDHKFGTLIFYKDDFTYYGPEFKSLLARRYSRDDSYPKITILRLR